MQHKAVLLGVQWIRHDGSKTWCSAFLTIHSGIGELKLRLSSKGLGQHCRPILPMREKLWLRKGQLVAPGCTANK